MKQTFTDTVEIDAPTQVGLVVTGPVAGVGAGAQLTTKGTGGRGWEILATGQAAAQGSDKLNIARNIVRVGSQSSVDVFTITSDGKVGIGTTSPEFKLEIDAPSEAGLGITGPNAGAIGAGIQLTAIDPGTVRKNSWQILATGGAAPQGRGKLNIRDLNTAEDIFTIVRAHGIGIGTTNPIEKLEVNGNVRANLFVVASSREIKDNILNLGSQEALEALEHLSPVKFNYKTEDAKNVHVGFVAEDVPELVATSNRKGVSIMDLVAILTQVVKEQQKTIKTLVEKTHMPESAVNGTGH